MKPWTLISPASRGIGLALARRVLQTTNAPVVTTARKDLDQTREHILKGLPGVDEERLKVLKMDVLDESSIESAASECKSAFATSTHHLHLAFAIPGILFPERSPAQVNAKDASLTFQTNTLGPLLMIKHFHELLPAKRSQTQLEEDADKDPEIWKGLHRSRATFAMMSARVGSITDNKLGGWYSYRASKAGVNQLVKTFDNHLKTTAGESVMAVGFHPGTVKTGLSKEFWGNVKKEKLFDPDFVAKRLVGMCADDGLDISGRGKCWDWDGKEVPP